MASPSASPPQKRKTVAEMGLVTLSLLLLLIGLIGLGQLEKVADVNSLVVRLLGGVPLPKAEPVTNAARLGAVDAIFIIYGAVASLVYLSKRLFWARSSALVVWLAAISTSIFLSIQGCTILAANPARGCFAGLANLLILIVHVILPSIVACMTLIAVVCLFVLRPNEQTAWFVSSWAELEQDGE